MNGRKLSVATTVIFLLTQQSVQLESISTSSTSHQNESAFTTSTAKPESPTADTLTISSQQNTQSASVATLGPPTTSTAASSTQRAESLSTTSASSSNQQTKLTSTITSAQTTKLTTAVSTISSSKETEQASTTLVSSSNQQTELTSSVTSQQTAKLTTAVSTIWSSKETEQIASTSSNQQTTSTDTSSLTLSTLPSNVNTPFITAGALPAEASEPLAIFLVKMQLFNGDNPLNYSVEMEDRASALFQQTAKKYCTQLIICMNASGNDLLKQPVCTVLSFEQGSLFGNAQLSYTSLAAGSVSSLRFLNAYREGFQQAKEIGAFTDSSILNPNGILNVENLSPTVTCDNGGSRFCSSNAYCTDVNDHATCQCHALMFDNSVGDTGRDCPLGVGAVLLILLAISVVVVTAIILASHFACPRKRLDVHRQEWCVEDEKLGSEFDFTV